MSHAVSMHVSPTRYISQQYFSIRTQSGMMYYECVYVCAPHDAVSMSADVGGPGWLPTQHDMFGFHVEWGRLPIASDYQHRSVCASVYVSS